MITILHPHPHPQQLTDESLFMSTIIQSICVKKIIDFNVMDDQVVEETHVPLDQSDKGGRNKPSEQIDIGGIDNSYDQNGKREEDQEEKRDKKKKRKVVKQYDRQFLLRSSTNLNTKRGKSFTIHSLN